MISAPRAMSRSSRGAMRYLPRTASRSLLSSRGLQRRWVQISTIPSGTGPQGDQLPDSAAPVGSESPDAKFEVLGAPYSLLSVTLSASQNLYTRRGSLVGLSGKAENTVSTLSTLEPLRRAILGIPFFYQKISSASPITALLATRSPLTSFTVVHLDGTIDWVVAQRRALLAWTGETISVTPTADLRLGPAHWGNSQVTGRGLLALVGHGQVYQILLRAGESYVAHPSNVLAYTVTKHRPSPYRLKSSVLRFQVPGLSAFESVLPEIKFFRVMRESATWKFLAKLLFNLRTWSRRTFYGDRLFLNFHGPATILLQSRSSRISDVLTSREINEIADSPAGAVQSAVTLDNKQTQALEKEKSDTSTPSHGVPLTGISYASVGGSGKVSFQKNI